MSKGYRRTSGYRNWVNKICWMARFEGSLAKLKSGRIYEIDIHGTWRRTK